MSRNSVASFTRINVKFALVRMAKLFKKKKKKKKGEMEEEARELILSQEAKGSISKRAY